LALSRIFLEDLKPYAIILIWSLMGYISGYISNKREGQSRPLLGSFVGSLSLAPLVLLDKNYADIVFITLLLSIGILSTRYSITLLERKPSKKAEISLKKRPIGVREILEAKKVTLRDMDPERLFKGVANYSEIKQELTEAIIWPLIRSDLAKEYGVKMAKGILLFGPSGCGKTLLSKAVTEELEVPFIYITGSDVLSESLTKAMNKIKGAFYRAKENAPSIIFIDELDELAPVRGTGFPGLVGELLSNMDDIKEFKGIVILAASNRP